MDITKLDTKAAANDGAKMEVLDLAGAPVLKSDGVTPVTITLMGKDSDAWIKFDNQVTNRRLAQGTRMKLTAEALKADQIKELAICTVGWDGIGLGDDETPFSYEKAVELYTLSPDIREQAKAFIEDRSNFSKASPTS